MSPQETGTGPDEVGPPSRADLRMADILSDETKSTGTRDRLRKEGGAQADDLLGRLNALDFIDSVMGEDHELPDRIGDYEITGILGRGGMGTVYKAFQQSLDREVALKVLAPRFSSDVTMRQRFRAEAKATAAMHHQHIVPIYGYGEASGHLFFAMELVAGVSLDKHIAVARRKGRPALEPLTAARRFAGVADALALAHKRQILHRDVKPGNLLVHSDGTIALADFGLSKFLGEVSAHLTSVGGFLGTLHYSPPEQARGEDLGPASDLYSLGVSLFEAVTGKLPLFGQSTESMLHALLNDEPKRLRDALPKAPRDLDAVLDKLLQKDPQDRYRDGEALAMDLRRIAEGEPVRIRGQSLASRVIRRVRRNPVMTTAVGVMVILLVVTGLWFKSLWDNEIISREQEGRQHVVQASIAVAQEAGSAYGPLGILRVLSGTEPEEKGGESVFVAEIDEARKRLPSEAEKLLRYRNAYYCRALKPEAFENQHPLELLERGNGIQALTVLDQSIKKAKEGYQTEDLGERIDLYNLLIASAVANLTASVSSPEAASRALNTAAFIRSGAVLPKLLMVFLDAQDQFSPQKLLGDLRGFLADKGDEVKRAAGEFLLAFAGAHVPAKSQLMRFPMGYNARRELSRAARDWLGGYPSESTDWYVGLAARLASSAKDLLHDLGDSAAMAAAAEPARRLLDTSLGEDSPLRSWAYTFDLLAGEKTSAQQLSKDLRLRGAIHFVRVVQRNLPAGEAETFFAAKQLSLGDLLDSAEKPTAALDPDSPVVLAIELRARLFSWIGEPQPGVEGPPAERTAADDWLRFDYEDPEAQLCKFCSLIRSGPKTEDEKFAALLPAVNAQQFSVRAAGLTARLVARLNHEMSRTPVGGAVHNVLRGLLETLQRSGGGNP